LPLHRHECESCGHQYRILVNRGTRNDAPVCPECGSTKSHRMLPLVAVHFKGSGYYKTDHGRKGGGSSKSGGEAEPEDSAKAKPSSASKPSSDSEPSKASKPQADSKARKESTDSSASAKSSSAE